MPRCSILLSRPQRFWAPAGSPDVYPDHASGLLTLISTALLHADWMHVIVNVLVLLVFGAPVARAFGATVTGWGLWMILFLGSVIAGSALYLALATVNSPFVVGASGGVFGLLAAALLLGRDGRKRALWSREFLIVTAIVAFADFAARVRGRSFLSGSCALGSSCGRLYCRGDPYGGPSGEGPPAGQIVTIRRPPHSGPVHMECA